MINYKDLEPVFVGFSASSGNIFNKVLGASIRFFTGGDSNHAYIVYFDKNWRTWLVVGANANGLTFQSIDDFLTDHIITHLFAAKGFRLWNGLAVHAGDLNKGYNYTGLFNMAWVEVGKKITGKPWGNHLSNDKQVFCSEWVSEVIKSALPEDMKILWPLSDNPDYHDDQVDPSFLCGECLKTRNIWEPMPTDIVTKAWTY